MPQVVLEDLAAGFSALGGAAGVRAAADAAVCESVWRFLNEVAAWNQRVNLVGVPTAAEMVIKHAIDSATICGVVELSPNERVLDVGAGGGFPGMILLLLCPEIHVTLMDASKKKCDFLQLATEKFGLTRRSQVVWGRAEEFGHRDGFRASYDLVVSRAVADLRILAEYCLPFCRVGGQMIAMKGPNIQEEMERAQMAIQKLGGATLQKFGLMLPEQAGARTLLVVEKVKPTPDRFPRRTGLPRQRPL